jgi:hypothetical protein
VQENNGFAEEEIVKHEEVTVYKNEDILDEIEDEFTETKNEIEDDLIQENESLFSEEDITSETDEIEEDGSLYRNW